MSAGDAIEGRNRAGKIFSKNKSIGRRELDSKEKGKGTRSLDNERMA